MKLNLSSFVLILSLFATPLSAQQLGPIQKLSNSAQQVPVVKAKAQPILVKFRAPDWLKVHTQNGEDTKALVDTFESIGFEVNQQQHGDHVDLVYRCPDWKTLQVDTQQQMSQWQNWLTKKQVDSVVLNPPANCKLPTVKYRLPSLRTAHLHDGAQAKALLETFEMLGCDVKTADHNGHTDLKLQCKEWLTIALTSEDTAHTWQDWLKQNGFETQHTHIHQNQK